MINEETDCVRLKRGVCRLDLKPCKENCSLRKTREEQRLYLEEVEQNKLSLEIEVSCSLVKRLSNIYYNVKKR